jgi:DNA modification methylase
MNANIVQQQLPINRILHGDCIEVMHELPANSVDFILTDPPYLVNYRDRCGRTIQNDANADWLSPAMTEAYRVLKNDRVAVMFYGWTKHGKTQVFSRLDTSSSARRIAPRAGSSAISTNRHSCSRRVGRHCRSSR